MILLYFLTLILSLSATTNEVKKGKILNLFSVVRFPNSVCAGDTLNGTCYSAEECSSRSGTQSGSCAGGYGVCCSFEKKCGQISSENCTYFQSSGTEVGQCRLKICPCNDNICQLRLDFQTFVINQPKTTAASVETTAAHGETSLAPLQTTTQTSYPFTGILNS